MTELTRGGLVRLLFAKAAPIAAGMLFQALYFAVDLYFVAALGGSAIAGVGAAGNVMLAIFALSQVLGVGTVALLSHAVGRQDRDEARLVFNQALALSIVCGIVTLAAGYLLAHRYMGAVAEHADTVADGVTYLYWIIPGLALQFTQVVLNSALRSRGIVRPTMLVQILTVALNALLAPILIAGWGTNYPMGVAGAGLATTIATVVGIAMLARYFFKSATSLGLVLRDIRPRLAIWTKMLKIGLPAGGEAALLFVYGAIIYWVIRDFGTEAQAGFAIGSRVMQIVLLPAMAIAMAATPITGQSFGAGLGGRVRETFNRAASMSTLLTLVFLLISQWRPELLIGVFTSDRKVLEAGIVFLQIISWAFVGQALVFTCSGVFQGLGDTTPALLSAGTRLLTFVLPAVWLSSQSDFQLEQLWYLSVASLTLQAVISLLLLQQQFRRRLVFRSATAITS